MFERYSFVAMTATDLARARSFWVGQLGFTVIEENPGRFFMVDAGGLRLCVDAADGDSHVAGTSDPVIGLKVASLSQTLSAMEQRGLRPTKGPLRRGKGSYAVFRDPDGREVIITEVD
jgi:catechol 2,3-dioxygenase-like lactoylglutathione lyase family enzyme